MTTLMDLTEELYNVTQRLMDALQKDLDDPEEFIDDRLSAFWKDCCDAHDASQDVFMVVDSSEPIWKTEVED